MEREGSKKIKLLILGLDSSSYNRDSCNSGCYLLWMYSVIMIMSQGRGVRNDGKGEKVKKSNQNLELTDKGRKPRKNRYVKHAITNHTVPLMGVRRASVGAKQY